jgi:NADH pyrophosphatase NudC (nudix superfamily)
MDTRQVFGSWEAAWAARKRILFCSQCGAKTEERHIYNDLRFVCSSCGYMDAVRPGPAVAVVVVQDDSVLLCKRAANLLYGGLWCLPSGGIEFNEDFLTAARRETVEETGVQVEIKGLLTVTSNFWDLGNNTVVPVLLAEPIGGELGGNAESQDVAWFTMADLPDLAFEGDRHIIERYFETRNPGVPIDLDSSRHDAPGATGVRKPPPASFFPSS